MGTSSASFTMTEEEFVTLEFKFGSNGLTDDEEDALINCVDARANATVYAFTDLLRDKNFAKIIKKLNKKGTWSGEWEEGSYALSVHGVEVAKIAIAKIEANHLFDEE